MRILHYQNHKGCDVFSQWFDALRDIRAKSAIVRRLDRAAAGNFGDHKFERDGVWAMRLDTGPGYRIYYFQEGHELIILLCGGDKSGQQADIARAIEYRKDFLRRLQ